jgi:UDP-N-acetyl-D-glucosamine dehydrogenase
VVRLSPAGTALLETIQQRRARAGVVGLGYVGLPLAVELGRAGLQVTGIDLDQRKVDAVEAGTS